MRNTTLLTMLAGTALLAHAVACSATSEADTTTSDKNEVIGGVDAKSASLDAVGSILYDDPTTSTKQLLCTGTLIAPNLVLTAKHCAMQKDLVQADGGPAQVVETRYIDALKISFAIGADVNAPKRLVPAESVETCNLANDGYMGLGCDVAVYRLQEAITDVKPLKVAAGAPAEDTVGKRMIAIGFGNQIENATAPQTGTRKMGSITMRALRGAPMKIVFPTVDAYIDAMREAEGEAYIDNYETVLRQEYERTLLEGYEIFLGATDGDAQVCNGDSGGPLLSKIDNELVVRGVASGVVSGVRLPCKFGAVYATFGPKAQELVKKALTDPCEGIPAEGRCDGDVAVRCTAANEGPRRVTRTDCSEALQRCIAPAPAATDGGVDSGAPAVVACGE